MNLSEDLKRNAKNLYSLLITGKEIAPKKQEDLPRNINPGVFDEYLRDIIEEINNAPQKHRFDLASQIFNSQIDISKHKKYKGGLFHAAAILKDPRPYISLIITSLYNLDIEPGLEKAIFDILLNEPDSKGVKAIDILIAKFPEIKTTIEDGHNTMNLHEGIKRQNLDKIKEVLANLHNKYQSPAQYAMKMHKLLGTPVRGNNAVSAANALSDANPEKGKIIKKIVGERHIALAALSPARPKAAAKPKSSPGFSPSYPASASAAPASATEAPMTATQYLTDPDIAEKANELHRLIKEGDALDNFYASLPNKPIIDVQNYVKAILRHKIDGKTAFNLIIELYKKPNTANDIKICLANDIANLLDKCALQNEYPFIRQIAQGRAPLLMSGYEEEAEPVAPRRLDFGTAPAGSSPFLVADTMLEKAKSLQEMMLEGDTDGIGEIFASLKGLKIPYPDALMQLLQTRIELGDYLEGIKSDTLDAFYTLNTLEGVENEKFQKINQFIATALREAGILGTFIYNDEDLEASPALPTLHHPFDLELYNSAINVAQMAISGEDCNDIFAAIQASYQENYRSYLSQLITIKAIKLPSSNDKTNLLGLYKWMADTAHPQFEKFANTLRPPLQIAEMESDYPEAQASFVSSPVQQKAEEAAAASAASAPFQQATHIPASPTELELTEAAKEGIRGVTEAIRKAEADEIKALKAKFDKLDADTDNLGDRFAALDCILKTRIKEAESVRKTEADRITAEETERARLAKEAKTRAAAEAEDARLASASAGSSSAAPAPVSPPTPIPPAAPTLINGIKHCGEQAFNFACNHPYLIGAFAVSALTFGFLMTPYGASFMASPATLSWITSTSASLSPMVASLATTAINTAISYIGAEATGNAIISLSLGAATYALLQVGELAACRARG